MCDKYRGKNKYDIQSEIGMNFSKQDLRLVIGMWAIATERQEICHANWVFCVTKAVTNKQNNKQNAFQKPYTITD